MRYFPVLLLLLFCSTSSCTSFHTTALGRLDTDSLFVDCLGHKGKGKGIPVKMKVPSHVTVTVYEQQVLIRGKEGVKLQSFSPPQFEVETGLAYTDKVFLVDFVRPAGGTLNLINTDNTKNGIEFDDEQYFKGIQAEVQERTMQQVVTALETVGGFKLNENKTAGAAGSTVSAQLVAPETELPNVHFEKSIVAYQRFDLARPHWEDEMNCFVRKYLGECGSCPSGVAKVRQPIEQKAALAEMSPVNPPILELLER
ncbi:hypothetical protein Pan153_39900 [Gimesia panareensis]|uniref:Lipoprotein n=1 Tax=Gimesia panareensis TaxID=2527978 RepID=A0A518FSQ1_9PLAN|nr:hypothetical protein [Gimesia panareensis]QDV19325.1 hypothetical protein Pan153_39900 [Gimesia panareensis]